MKSLIMKRIWLFAIVVPPMHACYKPDLHHELPCEITIVPPDNTGKTVTPTSSPSMNIITTDLPTSMTTIVSSPLPTDPPLSPPTLTPILPPSASPTLTPNFPPSASPTLTPNLPPSASPTLTPNFPPSASPILTPNLPPSASPILMSNFPLSAFPTFTPNLPPSESPTLTPNLPPSASSSFAPTPSPFAPPTLAPTSLPFAPPTLTPTLLPFAPPTLSPFAPPTLAPTVTPTSTPTIVPTVLPSIPPTVALIPPPTTAPTTSPSGAPSVKPTLSPSVTPTSSPTSQPSAQPSAAPTVKPTKATCQAKQGGFFGGVTDNPVLISYGYELETTPISKDTLQNEVLPALETGFVNSLLPELFGNDCSGRRLLNVARKLEISGVSARPDDVPLSNVQCKSQPANAANNCSVVSGELTLFASGNNTDEESLIQSILQKGMTNGTFVHANNHIVRVTYVNLGSYSSLVGGNTGTPKGTSPNKSNSYIFIAIPAVAAAILVLAAVFWRRRRRLAGDADDSTNPTASRGPRVTSGAVPGLDELPPGLPAPMSLEEGTVYTTESNQ